MALAARIVHDPRFAPLADPAVSRRLLLLAFGIAALAQAL